jgi:predicted O-methyltransferase YrrM
VGKDGESYNPGDYDEPSTKKAYANAKKIVEISGQENKVEFLIGDDLAILKKFPDHSLDWVYLDSSHKYEHTVQELEILKGKVKLEGVIMGHDWEPDQEHRHYGVYKAINEFCKKYNWEITELDRFTQWSIKRK